MRGLTPQPKQIVRTTLVGAVINILLAVIKIFVGWTVHAQSLVADGIHSLSDLVTDAAIMLGAKHWSAPPDRSHPYGHGRIETIVSIFIGISLAFVSFGIAWKSVVTIGKPHSPLGLPVLWVALFSIISKEILCRWTMIWGQKIKSKALLANAKHHRSDALSSIPVVIAVIGNYLFPKMTYLDNMAAFLIAGMLLKVSWGIVWPGICEILEARQETKLEVQITEKRKDFPEIKEIHKIRCRRVGGVILVDLHMLVNPKMSVEEAHKLSGKFKHNIIETEGSVMDVLIHIEPYGGG